jgi:hypothetical protein
MEPERYFRLGLSFVISNEREKSFSIRDGTHEA